MPNKKIGKEVITLPYQFLLVLNDLLSANLCIITLFQAFLIQIHELFSLAVQS